MLDVNLQRNFGELNRRLDANLETLKQIVVLLQSLGEGQRELREKFLSLPTIPVVPYVPTPVAPYSAPAPWVPYVGPTCTGTLNGLTPPGIPSAAFPGGAS